MKKIFAIMICIVCIFQSTVAVWAIQSNTNSGSQDENIISISDVVMKNLVTGEVTQKTYDEMIEEYPYTPPHNSESSIDTSVDNLDESTSSTQAIIGGDGRTLVNPTTNYPYSAIAMLDIYFYDGTAINGTAWMISDNVAVTAGHNLYHSLYGGWAERVYAYPGRNGTVSPFGSAYALEIYVAQDYINTEDSTTGHDWGLIWLNNNIGQSTGTIQFSYFSDTNVANRYVRLSGYPANGIDNTLYQYEMTGTIKAYTDSMLYYEIDTTPGNSGSPILLQSNVAFGIHVDGLDDPDSPHILGRSYNYATRITPYLYNLMNAYIAKCAGST